MDCINLFCYCLYYSHLIRKNEIDNLRIGIVGSGGIAAIVADAIDKAEGALISAVCSRSPKNALTLAKKHNIEHVFETWQEMIVSDEIDAVYIATPTIIKEDIAISAAGEGKHILVDKPFVSSQSLSNIVGTARTNKVAFLDGTHFVHNPRSAEIKNLLNETIGEIKLLRSTFFYPLFERDNIRFDASQEPLASVGDLGWYNMRAIVEYLDPSVEIAKITVSKKIDPETNIIVRCAGMISYKNDTTASFEFGFDADVCLMDLDIIGEKGMIRFDDFVLDWKNNFDGCGELKHGYQVRQNLDAPQNWNFVSVGGERPQKVLMIENFVKMCLNPSGEMCEKSMTDSLRTQQLVDQVWEACKQD